MTWSAENRSQLIRIPAAVGEYRRAELRSADPMTNPYIAYTLLIYAGMYGLEHDLQLCPASDFNVYTAPAEVLDGSALSQCPPLCRRLPRWQRRAHLSASISRRP